MSDGTDGLNALIETVTLAPGADCEAGGVTVYVGGIDMKTATALDTEEIQSSEIICQGVDGIDTLVSTLALCFIWGLPWGWVTCSGGLDNGDGSGIANNGVLEADEVDSLESICDGTNGTDRTSGTISGDCYYLQTAIPALSLSPAVIEHNGESCGGQHSELTGQEWVTTLVRVLSPENEVRCWGRNNYAELISCVDFLVARGANAGNWSLPSS